MSSPRCGTPKKGRKHLSPKKLSRGKRVPRCETCGKRDGDDVGEDQPGVKIRLKICARCRATAYCSMECQRARWDRHRLKCRKAEDVQPPKTFAAPSPRNRQGGATIVTVRRKIPPMTQTPRNRERVPTKHPFFPERSRDASPPFTSAVTPGHIPHRRERRQPQQPGARTQDEQDHDEDDGTSCPSPPTMQRLSMPIAVGGSSRHISKTSGMASATKLQVPEHRQFLRVVGGSSSTPPSSGTIFGERELRTRSASGDRVRSPLHSPGVRTRGLHRRSTYSPEAMGRITSSMIPRRAGQRPIPTLHRRESMPLFPSSLDDKTPARSRRGSTEASRERGPPPPYSYALSRRTSPMGTLFGVTAQVPGDEARMSEKTSSLNQIPPPCTIPSRTYGEGSSRSFRASSTVDRDSGRIRGKILLRRSRTTVEDTDSYRAGPRDIGERRVLKARVTSFSKEFRTSYAEGLPWRAKGKSGSMKRNPAQGNHSASAQAHPTTPVRSNIRAPAQPSRQAKPQGGTNDIAAIDTKRTVPEPPTREDRDSKEYALKEREGSDAAEARGEAKPTEQDESPATEEDGRDEAIDGGRLSQSSGTRHEQESSEHATSVESKGEDEGEGCRTKGDPCKQDVDRSEEAEKIRPKQSDEAKEDADGGAAPRPRHDTSIAHASLHTRDGSGGRGVYVADSPLPVPSRKPTTPTTVPAGAGGNGFSRETSTPVSSVSSSTVVNGFRESTTPAASPLLTTPEALATGAMGSASRRFSPKPRPPVSPGPAALTLSLSPKPPSILPEVVGEPDGITSRNKVSKIKMPTVEEVASAAAEREAELEAERETARALARSAISPTHARSRAMSMNSIGCIIPQSTILPFVPVVEFSPERKPPTPHNPGPRRTDTTTFYQRRLGRFRGSGLPPASKTYLGRPAGFSVHVLVATAPTIGDLMSKPDSPVRGGTHAPGRSGVTGKVVGSIIGSASVPPALRAARAERALRAASGSAGKPWIFYSFEERGRVAEALRPGDVVLLTPGRYEARAWGLQHLVSSVEIIGVGAAKACVVYNNAPPSRSSSTSGVKTEHYLVGVMGDPAAVGNRVSMGAGGSIDKEDVNGDVMDDDSDSGWEDGALSAAAVATTFGRAVRVRLANLTLEQGSGCRGTLYQLGRESHLELDGCVVRCSQGGVNVDQGTCLVCDCTIEGSETFGVHIGGEGVVEHCIIRDCGWGGGGGVKPRTSGGGGRTPVTPGSKSNAGNEDGEDDDGTDVNRAATGMPAISILQGSRVRARFNVIRENAGHALQCRDAPPWAVEDNEHARLVQQAEVEAEEQLRSWLGDAAVLLQDHLSDSGRPGSITAEGNLCQRNRRCSQDSCSSNGYGRCSSESNIEKARVPERASAGDGRRSRAGSSVLWNSDGPICGPTGEEEGLPLPAAMTLRFLAAMDDGYVGSMREENARLRKRRVTEGGAG